ncbi:sugar transferase [Rhizobium rosettiformans]|uniref:sugar transferase n=1 Tax=Rhizobium rosettiformans TaxID=1368430 RepID=UPI00286623EF|nr:sugar transferase [Rhizobium rosettiformans]MDR7029007.1 lipopolysaccharide/colanic/teichoic acid biosynthesis glycosyltransferase [Rhizobium rosettiformans]MDR7063711.1 lipopolysaccharide/colanic/teichoic acid biosynthesis glycosyltransferase [Rhizobium rosettiformans]
MIKRIVDIIGSAAGLLILSPVFLVVSVLIWVRMGQPILFVQTRPGLGAKPFRMVKFRTMRNAYDRQGNPLSDAERLTKLGKVLRSTSLDELPELWNVLKGEMSLVGPRPLLMEYLPLYSPIQASRHNVRPGITGWAQIHGRNAISWDEKLALDAWYVENHNLKLDFAILLNTVAKVIKRDGISAAGEATMPKFKGPGS